MAAPLSAAAFAAALRDEGLTVVEVGNWRTHNRNHVGPWGPVHGVMIHHTVTSGSARTVELCRTGHSTLPGPLCHGVITKDGVVHLVGYGRANHAGLGDGDVLRAVINEAPLPADNEANTDGNRHFYGFECENLGDGKDPWPEAQKLAIEKASAALCRAHGWGERSVIGHLEWQPGKVDPRGFTMADMRGRIAKRLARPGSPSGGAAGEEYAVQPGDTLARIAERFGVDVNELARINGITDPNLIFPGQKLIIPSEGDMALSDADVDRIARRVLTMDGVIKVSWGSESNPEWMLASVLNHVGEVTRENRGRVKEIQAVLAQLATEAKETQAMLAQLVAEGAARDAVLAQLAQNGGLDAAEVKAAAEAGAEAFADRLGRALSDGS